MLNWHLEDRSLYEEAHNFHLDQEQHQQEEEEEEEFKKAWH
jgi:hypothetical protein